MAGSLIFKAESLQGGSEGSYTGGIASRLGAQVVMDFYTYMALIGKAFNVRAGTISAPVVGDVVITDTAAEMCVDAPTGTTVIPVFCNINFNLAAATLFECAGKSVGTVSTAGTAFVPLPLRPFNRSGGTATAAVATARVQAAGAVTVTAELATTTRRHFAWGHPIAAGAWPTIYDWSPRVPPPLVGPYCFYVQIGADTTGPSYFASVDFIEGDTEDLM